MYSESERSASSAMRRRRSSRSCSTHTRMASVFFSGTDAMVVKKAGITHGHRSAAVRLWRCRAITTGRVGCGPTSCRRILIAREANGPQDGRRDGYIGKVYRGQITGGGHVVLAFRPSPSFSRPNLALAVAKFSPNHAAPIALLKNWESVSLQNRAERPGLSPPIFRFRRGRILLSHLLHDALRNFAMCLRSMPRGKATASGCALAKPNPWKYVRQLHCGRDK